MGDSAAPSAQESTKEMMQALQENLPGYMAAIRKEIVPTAQAQYDASASLSPKYADLTKNLYDTSGRDLNRIGEEIAASNQMAKAKSDAAVLAGPGLDIIKQADAAQRAIDPEFYALKAGAGKLGTDIMKSYGDDPTKLSGGEAEAVSRGLAQEGLQRGTFATPSQVDTVQNAMAFGDAANKRRESAAGVLGTVSGAMPATRSGVDVLQQATGRPGQSNAGAGQFTGAQQGLGDQAFGQAQALMGQAGANQQTAMQINAQRRSPLDFMNQTMGAVGSCCFIMLEGHNGTLPWWVRSYRDLAYSTEPRVAQGYKWMAKWLVPLMQRSALIKGLVNDTLVAPLTAYGGWFYSVPGYEHGKCYAAHKRFWFGVWRACSFLTDLLGRSGASAFARPRKSVRPAESRFTSQSGADVARPGSQTTGVPAHRVKE